MYVIVVVSSALMPMIVGLHLSAAAMNFSTLWSTPMSCTSKPAPSAIMQTRFLPMSCRSPRTVPMSSVPTRSVPLSFALSSGLSTRHAGLHRAGGDQHFRDVEDVVLEVFADDAHAGDQAVGEHLLNSAAPRRGRPWSSVRLPWPCPRRGTDSSMRNQASIAPRLVRRCIETLAELCGLPLNSFASASSIAHDVLAAACRGSCRRRRRG